MKINQIYHISYDSLKDITLYHAHIAFMNGYCEIEYEYDDEIHDEVRAEAIWFDKLTYTF